jgi:hypothetical protein
VKGIFLLIISFPHNVYTLLIKKNKLTTTNLYQQHSHVLPEVGRHWGATQHEDMDLLSGPQQQGLQGWKNTKHPQHWEAHKHYVQSLVGALKTRLIPEAKTIQLDKASNDSKSCQHQTNPPI